jgi:hypothetical protein
MLKFVTNTRPLADTQYTPPAGPLDLGQVFKLGAWEKARLAADWHNERVELRRTIANTVRIFHVSAPYIVAAGKERDKPTGPSRTLKDAWMGVTATERREFARIIVEASRALDDATAPPVIVQVPPIGNGHAAPHPTLLG